MEQQPLWKLNSGEFLGMRRGDDLYDAKGHHVAYFRGNTAYLLNGDYLGEITDREFLARPVNRKPAGAAGRGSRGQINVVPRHNRSPRPSKSWEDPKI